MINHTKIFQGDIYSYGVEDHYFKVYDKNNELIAIIPIITVSLLHIEMDRLADVAISAYLFGIEQGKKFARDMVLESLKSFLLNKQFK